ncbi:MAG: hypothetical protein KDK11_10300 [Maritimibacter sp.]|nr:hypothetical protein [Maritimibacter sp.]
MTDLDDVAIVDFEDMTVSLESGVAVPITSMFDRFGDDCADPDRAVSLVAGPLPTGGGYVTIDLSDVELVTSH